MNILDQIPEGWNLYGIRYLLSVDRKNYEYDCELFTLSVDEEGSPEWVIACGSTPDEALKLACDKAREYNIQHIISENTKLTKPCKSPYCECDVGNCTHPDFHDARGE